MTSTTTETAAPSTSRHHPAGENLISYRSAREFRDSKKRRVDDDPQKQWLRVFRDGHDVLRAGLYDTAQPDLDDHWANGETLTDETDAAMITTCLAGAGTETMKTALLGIAYARISDARPRPLNIGVPEQLKPWAVRVADSAGKDDIQYVMADCSDAAKATAAVLAFERTMRKARTTCLA